MGNRHPTIAPYESFPTADGEIVVAVGNDDIWRRFCTALDRPELAQDPRYVTNKERIANYAELRGVLEQAMCVRTRLDWVFRVDRCERSAKCWPTRNSPRGR